MTDANLGTARIDILIDTASMNAGISDAKNRVSSMGAEFEARFEKMSQAEKRATLEVLKFNDSLGRTREEMKLLNAGARGAAPEALEQLRKSLLNQRKEMDAGGISAKAYAAAMRGVPAQMTDIAVSLQGGQQPLTVLLQQGGQLKDMLGGIVPAAKALASSLLGLVNPYTVTAAAIAAVSYAAYEADDVQDRFVTALAKSGNVAASTATEMQKLAAELQDNVGASTAAAAVESVVASGQIGAQNLATVTRAAADASKVLGSSVEDVVATYVKLGDKPLETLLSLNKTENFLSAAQYERIRALEEEGNKQAAANEAIQIYFDHQQAVIQQVRQNYSESKRFWEDLKVWIDNSTASVGAHALSVTNSLAQITAKLRAPVESGALRGAIYLAYREGKSTETTVVYAVTWNSRKAPHGHLQEFGHWAVQGGKRGKGGTETSWVPAKPFLRPAFEASLGRMSQAMMERGRERLAELLRDMYTPRDEEFV